MHALLSDPGGTAATGQSGIALLVAPVLPSAVSTASAPTIKTHFGALSHGLHDRCLRFAATVTRVLPYGRARLASGWWPTLAGQDLNLLDPVAKFQLVLHGILLTQACPGAPKHESKRRRVRQGDLEAASHKGA
jgi:hypothetical protein